MSVENKSFIAIIVAAILWGTAVVVAKILLLELSPFVITFYRFTGAAIILFPFVSPLRKSRKFWSDLVPLSLFNTGNVLFFYLGLRTTTAVASSIIASTTPLIVLLFSSILIKERSTLHEKIGIVIGLLGACAVIVLPALNHSKALIGDIRGNFLISLGVVSWALYAVGSRKFISQRNYTPLETAMVNFTVTGIVSGLLAIMSKNQFVTPRILNVHYLSLLLFAIVGLTLITFSLFQFAVKHVPATTASLKDYIQLIVGIGLSIALLHEPLTPVYLIGTSVVVIGVFIATGQRISKRIAALLMSQVE